MASTESGRRFVRYALKIGSMELTPEGRPLKSKRISPYFFNAGLFHSGRAIYELAMAYAMALEHMNITVIFGPAYKGIPLAVATAIALDVDRGVKVGWAFNRKEAKDHGEGGNIVGHPLDNELVAGIDDVISTASTADELVAMVKANKGKLVCYAIAFDRQERGTGENGLSGVDEFRQKHDVPVIAAADLDDLIAVLQEDKSIPLAAETLPLILAYRDKYRVQSIAAA